MVSESGGPKILAESDVLSAGSLNGVEGITTWMQTVVPYSGQCNADYCLTPSFET